MTAGVGFATIFALGPAIPTQRMTLNIIEPGGSTCLSAHIRSRGPRVKPSHTDRTLRACLALLSFTILSAQAAPYDNGNRPGFHAVQRLGVTVGGNVISRLTRSDGTIREISTGGLYQIGLGALYQAEHIPFSTALTLNYHYNADKRDNDNASFRRIPLEAIVYFNGLGDLRIGGGIRYNMSARADSNLNGVNETLSFKNSKGSIIEIGYQVRPGGWICLRHVKETYEIAARTTNNPAPTVLNDAQFDGSHSGLFLSFEY